MLKVFTTNDFEGHWPVGTSAVIVAKDEEHARELMDKELQIIKLWPQQTKYTLEEVDTIRPGVIVLQDGDY